MINIILHGFYDDAGCKFALNLEEVGKFNIVHWYGSGECRHPRGFDIDILDLHMGQIPEGPYDYDNNAWLEVEEHKEQIRKELIRGFVNDWKDEHIYSLIYSYTCYCVSLIRRKEVGLIVFGNIPHEGFDTILYRVAIGMKLKLRIFFELPYLYARMIKRVEEVGEFSPMTEQKCSPVIGMEQVCSLAYMKNAHLGNCSFLIEKYCYSFVWPIFKFMRLKMLYWRLLYGASGLKNIDLKLYGQFKKHLARASSRVIPVTKYVYVPLHLQPEMTTCALGGKYDDQALLIEDLRKWLPDNVSILIKENPKQGKRFPVAASRLYRNKNFFQRISKLKGVSLVPQNYSTDDLIESSEFVATVTGTAGFEALLRGKNCLVFGFAWYRKFRGVFEWSSQPGFQQLMEGVDRQLLEIDCRQYLNASFYLGGASSVEISDWYTNQLISSLDCET